MIELNADIGEGCDDASLAPFAAANVRQLSAEGIWQAWQRSAVWQPFRDLRQSKDPACFRCGYYGRGCFGSCPVHAFLSGGAFNAPDPLCWVRAALSQSPNSESCQSMNIEQLLRLRKRVDWSQSRLAAEMKVSVRTISNWETSGSDKQLSECDSKNICHLFQPLLLEKTVKEMALQAFEAIPSEQVAIWLVVDGECISLPNTTYLHFSPEIEMARASAPLVIESLTTYPLRSGESLNLAGDAILHHKAKKYKHNRASHLFKNGICESLLHIPASAAP